MGQDIEIKSSGESFTLQGVSETGAAWLERYFGAQQAQVGESYILNVAGCMLGDGLKLEEHKSKEEIT